MARSLWHCAFIALAIVSSCQSPSDETSTTKFVMALQDTARMTGKAQVFYANGKLKEEIDFKDGLRQGFHVGYWEDGAMAYKDKYHDGKRGGTSYSYYPSGAIATKTYWLDGLQYGESIWYDEDGKISLRGFYDFDGEGFCSAAYTNSDPALPVVDGLAVSPAYWDYPDLDSLTQGDTCSVQMAIATFPGMRTHIACYLDNVPLPLHSIDSSMATVLVSPHLVGRYQLRVEGSIRDENGVVRASNQFKAKVVVVPRP